MSLCAGGNLLLQTTPEVLALFNFYIPLINFNCSEAEKFSASIKHLVCNNNAPQEIIDSYLLVNYMEIIDIYALMCYIEIVDDALNHSKDTLLEHLVHHGLICYLIYSPYAHVYDINSFSIVQRITEYHPKYYHITLFQRWN